MVEFPVKEFCGINRVLFLAFDDCSSDEAIELYQAATREVESATKAVTKLYDFLKKEKKP